MPLPAARPAAEFAAVYGETVRKIETVKRESVNTWVMMCP